MRTLLLITCSLFATGANAEHCPSVHDLQTNHTARWKAYDSDSGQPLSVTRAAKLKLAVAHFAMAEWSNAQNKSVIHCYYNDEHGSAMEAFFAKDSTSPLKSSKYWYPVTGMMQCAAGAEKCQFQSLPGVEHQFAASSLRGVHFTTKQSSQMYAAE